MYMWFQPGVPAFTVKQPEHAMSVLRDRSKEIGVSDHSDLVYLSKIVQQKVIFKINMVVEILPPAVQFDVIQYDLLLQCPLWVCPELEDYQADDGPLRLGLAGQHQRSNASLALQLSHTWLQRRCLPGRTGCESTFELYVSGRKDVIHSKE